MNNPVLIGTGFNHQVRFYFVNSKELAQGIIDEGTIYPISLIALTNTMSITGMMGVMEKSPVKILSVINADGACGKIYVQANEQGQVRGIVSNRYVDLPLKDHNFDLAGGVGTIGNIELTKDYGLKTPYCSETSIIKGDILSDFSYYYSYSEQTPTAISGGVLLNEDYSVAGAGILMVQVMPDCCEETINRLETNVVKYQNISQLLTTHSMEDILGLVFENDFEVLEVKSLSLYCDCSYEKCVTNINLLSEVDKAELKQNPPIEMVCDWCLTKYNINADDIIVN